jgi:hypothetical protein
MIEIKYLGTILSPEEMEEDINKEWLKHSDSDFYKKLDKYDLHDYERAYKFGAYKAMYKTLYNKIEFLNDILNLQK